MVTKSRLFAALRTGSSAVVALALLFSHSAGAFTESDLQSQLQRLVSWWPGEYDNNEQIVRQSGGGLAKPVYEPISRVYTHAVLLDRPGIGEHVVYVEQYRDNDPDKVARIRVYSLQIDLQAQAIRARPHEFRDESQAILGIQGQAALADIETGALRALPAGCDVLIRFEGGQFRGQQNPETCAEGNGFDREFVIGERHYWFRDFSAAAAGREAPAPFVESTRARRFVCSVAYNLEGDMTKTEPLTEIELHDQGGAAEIDWPDGRTLEFVIHTREFASPSDRVFPLYRIHEKGNHVPIAYAYAVDDADRFGLNLGWFYILCREKEQGAPET
jgi:hypothetical protein